MTAITEGRLTFTFPGQWDAVKYDDWSFYRNQFNGCCGGTKAVDILAIGHNGAQRQGRTLWVIEVKDYRIRPRTKPSDLGDEVAAKVRDSLAGLVAAARNAHDSSEKSFARSALASASLRIVLHLEQPVRRSKLFPRLVDPSNVQMKLKRLLKSVDPRVRVLEVATHARSVSWTVA
ncbi:MAG: hypothetical protein HQL63_09280 [Magnetococcales bacterium]|nr:hypothetical protein [Magnetococcales bacterium]MBF0322622.1 hypothetical protein [Magnetococcales bacterium]